MKTFSQHPGLCILIIFGVAAALPACADLSGSQTAGLHSPFQIAIERGDRPCSSPDLGISFQTAWPVLKESLRSMVIHRIELDGIETYDWSEQSIVLTSAESHDFDGIMRDESGLPVICLYGFVVLADDTPVYGGQFMFSQSAMFIDFPVIYFEEQEDRIRLLIRPYHTVTGIDVDDPRWRIIKDERIKDQFSAAGKLVE